MSSSHQDLCKINKESSSGAGEFYKGLFFGVLLGVGLIWFLGTKEGEKLKKELGEKGDEFLDKAKESIDQALSKEQPLNQFFEEQT